MLKSPVVIVTITEDKSARLLIERSFHAQHYGVRLTCIAEESDRCQGVFLQSHELRPLILALLEEVEDLGALARICESSFALLTSAAAKDTQYFIDRDLYNEEKWGRRDTK